MLHALPTGGPCEPRHGYVCEMPWPEFTFGKKATTVKPMNSLPCARIQTLRTFDNSPHAKAQGCAQSLDRREITTTAQRTADGGWDKGIALGVQGPWTTCYRGLRRACVTPRVTSSASPPSAFHIPSWGQGYASLELWPEMQHSQTATQSPRHPALL